MARASTTRAVCTTPSAARALIGPAWASLLAQEPELAALFADDEDGHELAEYTDLDYSKHVDTMLAALDSWKKSRK